MCVALYITLPDSGAAAAGRPRGVWLQPGARAAPSNARLRARPGLEGKSEWDLVSHRRTEKRLKTGLESGFKAGLSPMNNSAGGTPRGYRFQCWELTRTARGNTVTNPNYSLLSMLLFSLSSD